MPELKKHLYNKNYPEIFEKEKKEIFSVMLDCEIHHIGSTAVSGLGGKGIIDIMIGIENWKEAKDVIKKLKELGFLHIHLREKGRIFLSKDKSLSLDNVHIHITKIGSKAYKEFLAFRDYLRRDKKETEKYSKLKSKWIEESQGNRGEYRRLKGKYVEKIIGKI